jgi:ActR/RegA family two-component response regulator
MRDRVRILLIEDGHEYEEFARLFLADGCEIEAAHSASEALERASAKQFDAFLVDLRFERASPDALLGDVDDTARRLFAGDKARALRWLKDQQGTLVLAELRRAGHVQRAVFVHDFPRQRLANLRRLYGEVLAVPGFDAAAIREALGIAPVRERRGTP